MSQPNQVTDAILYALEQAGLEAGGPVLLIPDAETKLSSRFPEAVVWQPQADQAARWKALGHEVPDALPEADNFQTVILLCPRQKDECLYLLAQGLRLLKAGGLLIAAAANLNGGQSLPKLFESLGIKPDHLSKHKARVAWTKVTDPIDLDRALISGRPQLRADGLMSQPGLFSWAKTDAGTSELLHHLPFSLSGIGADFGCGIGILGQRLLQRHKDIARLYCIDKDSRAVACARHNLAADAGRCTFLWADVRDLKAVPPLDFIVMNPPFHAGKADANELGQAFIAQAAAHLKPGGMLSMVANVHLPYEAQLRQLFSLHRLVGEARGFKIFEAVK